MLWHACFKTIAFDFLQTRAEQARTGMGWRDCGSDLQEFSSHVVAVDGICDVLETVSDLSPEEQSHLRNQIVVGCTYLSHLQDKAEQMGLSTGAVIHEDRQDHVVTGNVAKAAMIFARASRLLQASHPDIAASYINRAKSAFDWLEIHGPVCNPEAHLFYPHVHGAPPGSVPPEGRWMTRDLLMMTRAALECYKADKEIFQSSAITYANRILKRQAPQYAQEDGLYGHFYTYENFVSFGGIPFTEKANIHCGAWSKEGRIYNKGGHYPHHLLPLIEMLQIWPDHPRAVYWQQCIKDFAYGYFLPACQRSPFLILPAGYYRDEGLLYFSSWYHAHNNIYAFAASLSLAFAHMFNDPQFRPIAVGNLQWIAGLNCGLKEETETTHLPVSMIVGVGRRSRGSWTKIPGSVCNGFSASKQFRIEPASAETDRPVYFDDEAYIAHSLPLLAALAKLKTSPRI